MFRGQSKAPIDPKNFGVGSVVKIGDRLFMAIAFNDDVTLLDLEKFTIGNSHVTVQDVNYMSEEEVRDLVENDRYTFTDCEFFPAGLKTVNFADLNQESSRDVRGIRE